MVILIKGRDGTEKNPDFRGVDYVKVVGCAENSWT